jgi:hypothetical protein
VNGDLWGVIAAPAMAGELALMTAGGYALFRGWGYTLAEAAGCGIVAAFMMLSFLFQVALLLDAPTLMWIPEASAGLLAASQVWRRRDLLTRTVRAVSGFTRSHRACLPLAAALLFLGIMSLTLPADPGDRPGLLLRPVNHTILPHLFLRAGSDTGPDLFGFLAYLSVGFSTYALSRRYAWPPTAFTVVLVIMGMPRLVWQTTTWGPEIVPAAAALCCLVCIYRLVEVPDVRDLALLVMAIPFTFSANPLGGAAPCILLALAAVLLFRRHGALIWRAMIAGNRAAFLAVLLPVIVFSQTGRFIGNLFRGDPWLAPPAGVVPNPDGLQGAAANVLRYLLESAHFTRPLDGFCNWAFDFRLTGFLQWLNGALIQPVFDGAGAAAPFRIIWVPNGPLSGFGPFAFLLVLPGVIFALIRANRHLKTIALGLLGYVYIVTLAAAWMAGNEHYATLFFACGGFCTAFLLPPWRLTRRWKQGLQLLCLLLIAYVVAAEFAVVFGLRY